MSVTVGPTLEPETTAKITALQRPRRALTGRALISCYAGATFELELTAVQRNRRQNACGSPLGYALPDGGGTTSLIAFCCFALVENQESFYISYIVSKSVPGISLTQPSDFFFPLRRPFGLGSGGGCGGATRVPRERNTFFCSRNRSPNYLYSYQIPYALVTSIVPP